MKKSQNVEYIASKSFPMWNTHIRAVLAGYFHQFEFEGVPVTVRLPSRPKEKIKNSLGDFVPESNSLECLGYRKVSNRVIPLDFKVLRVRLEIDGGWSCKSRQKSIGNTFRWELSKHENQKVTRQVEYLDGVADRAFQYWIEMLRWKTEILQLRPEYGKQQTELTSTHLRDKKFSKQIVSTPLTLNCNSCPPISRKLWNFTQQALSNGEEVPIWHIYLADAHMRILSGDGNRAILSMAISIETILRQVLRRFLAKPYDPTFTKLVDKLSIDQILTKWKKFQYLPKRLQTSVNSNELRKILSKRNAVMHRGEHVSASYCRDKMEMVKKFINEAEKTQNI